jgi:hypothetical protein
MGSRGIDWTKRPASVPIPGREPYSCALCGERCKQGEAVRWGPRREKAVHDACARKLTPETTEPLRKPKAEPRGPLTLDRWPGEQVIHHRALLLWAMQHPSKRNQRAVARAISKSEGSIRQWCSQQRWHDRASAPRADADAVLLYRQLYLADHGATELPEVAPNVVVSVAAAKAESIPLSEVDEDVRAADRLVREEILRKRQADEDVRKRHVQLVDAGIGYVVNEMKAGRLRASLRDIPTLLQARALLSGEAGSQPAGTQLAVETVRVRVAREQGRDIIDALGEDLAELSTIVSALKGRREAAQEVEPRAANDGGPTLRVVEPLDG